jgi:tetratricopeptide (TPR) repeat protein
MQKWSDAEHAFSMMRKRTDREELSRPATIGLAHALYRQRRFTEAQTLYESGYRRWPKIFRVDPLALERFAMTQVTLHQEASGRELLILFYNLYPRHAFAPAALLQVAEGLLDSSQPSLAEFFYALTSSLYMDSVQGAIARMRTVTLRADRMLPAGQNWVGLTVSAMLHDAAIPDQQEAVLPTTLHAIARQYAEHPAGTEALVRLAHYFETRSDMGRALVLYKTAVLRHQRADDPWPEKAAERLSDLLKPWLEAAVTAHDDLTVAILFHRHGPFADRLYAGSPLLPDIAEAHRRLGFLPEAVRLYQPLGKSKDPRLLEAALIGLGRTYLDQRDPESARKVLERYRFQFPSGRYESEVLELLVAVMERQGDLEGLLHLCRNWLLHHRTHPHRATMYLHLAGTLGRLDKWDESAMAYKEAFKAGAEESPETWLAYADVLSKLARHEEAIAAYRTVLKKNPSTGQTEWAHLQSARHWHVLRQDDRAAAALSQLEPSDDLLLHRYSSSLKGSLQAAPRPTNEESL